MRTLYLMQGIPGSGKSTLARKIVAEPTNGTPFSSVILSTDEFWITHVEHEVHYEFDPYRLDEAHRWNQKRAMDAMEHGVEVIVIDNTNIISAHAAPYRILAHIFEYQVVVVRVIVSVDVAIERQQNRPIGRRVPEDTILRMARQMEDLL